MMRRLFQMMVLGVLSILGAGIMMGVLVGVVFPLVESIISLCMQRHVTLILWAVCSCIVFVGLLDHLPIDR